MKRNRLIAFALSVSLLLGASACGKPAKTVSELIAEENAILDQHQELWTTALNSLDKDNLSQSTQSTNYADVLDLAIKNVKEQLSDEDYKTLTDDAAKVRKLEDQLQELPPEEGTTASDDSTFPAFEGKDLDGIVSQLRLTQGVEVAMFIYELETQSFKVSLRSNGKVDVSKIAVYFGGGGHKRAAGCDLQGSMYDVINNISEQICKQFQELEI
mgnify:CR=1 FL=1